MLHKLEKALGLPEDSLTYDEEARKKMVYSKSSSRESINKNKGERNGRNN